MSEQGNRPKEGEIHIGGRPWYPPIKGQPSSPQATTAEIWGDDAPTIEGGKFSRRLRPKEKISKTRTWRSPEVIFSARRLEEQIREELSRAHDTRFTEREVICLQGLVNGVGKRGRARELTLLTPDLKTFEGLIAEKVGFDSRQEGLRVAIFIGVRDGDLDTRNIHLKPKEPLGVRESQVLIGMIGGSSTSQLCNQLGISGRSVRSYRESAYEKIGVHTSYQAMAWAAKDMLMRGQL